MLDEVGNVTFESVYLNNWLIYDDEFYLLFVTGEEGWYQEESKFVQCLKHGVL